VKYVIVIEICYIFKQKSMSTHTNKLITMGLVARGQL